MMRWTIAATFLVLGLVGCAHSDRIKAVSKEQESLLATYKTALDDVRSRVRTAFDESIGDYKEARLRQWLLTEGSFLSTQIVRCSRTPATCAGKDTRVLLDEAVAYLVQGQATLVAGFCGQAGAWQSVRQAWMGRRFDQCPDKPQETVGQLEKLRTTLDASLRQLADDLVSVAQAHAIIDRFLQVRVEIREEDVDAAKQAVAKATAAVQDARTAMLAIAKEQGR